MTDAPLTAPPSAADRLARALGWTPGQVWTVALGLALAIPAGIFGLGPTLDDVAGTATSIASPSPVAAPAVDQPATAGTAGPAAGAAPGAPPLQASDGGATTASGGVRAGAPVGAEGGPPGGSTSPPVIANVGGAVTIPGPGQVRGVAATADGAVVAVDRGAGAPGSVVVIDDDGEVTVTADLVVDGVAHEAAQGIAVDGASVLVTTASPPAVLRVDPVAGTVEAVATIPNLETCVPVARETGCQPGAVDTAPGPGHLTVGPDGTAYVVDQAQACVFRIAGGDAAPWLCDLTYTPSPAVAGSGLQGIASTDGAVVLSARLAIGGRNVVEEIAIEDGEAGARRQLADLEPTEEVDGLTVLDDGRVAVALAAPGAVLVIAPDDPGDDQRITGFDRPADIASRGDDLLVVEQATNGAGALRTRGVPQR